MQKIALIYLELPQCDKSRDIDELQGLASTANAEIVLTIEQKRTSPDPVTIVGSGKLYEIKAQTALFDGTDNEIDLVLFSVNLGAAQRSAIEKKLDKPVIDRIDLILDIFAMRATTAEGKTQVELAQLSYSFATRPDNSKLSRQGGGIGTRGPGETKLETNKRAIRDRMHKLRVDLKEIAARRDLTRKRRTANKAFLVALVGYTNAGKSTLFNALTDNRVYADDKLFATLDTTVRRTEIDGMEVLFSDTVGFIDNLPHALVDAFKSTLEETKYADLVLHVIDVSDPHMDVHMHVTDRILAELGVTSPVVRVFNKCDKPHPYFSGAESQGVLFVSALNKDGLSNIKALVSAHLTLCYATVKLAVPFAECGKVLAELGAIDATYVPTNRQDCMEISVKMRRKYLDKFVDYLVL